MMSVSAGVGRIFVYDGVLLVVLLYVLILLIAAARKRIALAFPTTTVAFVLALVLGLLAKFGFKSA
jgi:FtsH-binding integral membrane protein